MSSLSSSLILENQQISISILYMQAVILLTLVILAGLLFKKEKSPYARMIIGAIFGIMFFNIWPYSHFVIEMHGLDKNYHFVSYFVISVTAILLSFLALKLKHKQLVAVAGIFLFILTTVFTMSYESELKNRLSIITGYFKQNSAVVKNTTYPQKDENRKIITAHNYIFSLKKQWRKNSDKGPLFEYFQLLDKDKIIAELRPKCFNSKVISLPEILNNLANRTQLEDLEHIKHCAQTGGTSFTCRISYLTNNKIKRIQWYLLDTNFIYGVELDFILYKNQPSIHKEVDKVINSAKITTKQGNNCLGLTEWM